MYNVTHPLVHTVTPVFKGHLYTVKPVFKRILYTVKHAFREHLYTVQPVFKNTSIHENLSSGDTSISRRKCLYMRGVSSSQILYNEKDQIQFWEK